MDSLLHELIAVRELKASALPALASLQPLAVLGAPYVLPGRATRPPPGLALRDPSDCSWSETDASATERVKGKGERRAVWTEIETL